MHLGFIFQGFSPFVGPPQTLQPLDRNVQWFRGGLVFEAQTLVSLSLRLKDHLGPVTRVKKKKKRTPLG